MILAGFLAHRRGYKKDSQKITKNESGMKKGYDRAYKLIDATVKSIQAQSAAASN